MLTEKDAYASSILIMKETYSKAYKYEFLQTQKDCADNLSSFFQMTGDDAKSRTWLKLSKELEPVISEYNRVHYILETQVHRIHCCENHKSTFSEKVDYAFAEKNLKIRFKESVPIQKSMLNFLNEWKVYL